MYDTTCALTFSLFSPIPSSHIIICSFAHGSKRADTLHKSEIVTSPPSSHIFLLIFSLRDRQPHLALGTCTHVALWISSMSSVLLQQFAWSLAQASTPSSPVTLLTIVDASEFVQLANTLYISLLVLKHVSLFASTITSSFKRSSAFLAPPVSTAFNNSARTAFIPDTAVLIFHDQFCRWSQPPGSVSMLSNPLMFSCCLL